VSAAPSIAPQAMAASLWNNRGLLLLLIKREIAARYRGSMLGLFWSLLNPLLMLSVYTFIFGVVMQARWGTAGASTAEFAMILFAGLLVYMFFAECVTRAPSLILANANYVKKVVFPLEILPWVAFGAALFQMAISFIVWLAFYFFIFGTPPMTALLFPVVLIPLFMLTMGVSWFLASLGVFLRDVTQVVGVAVTALLFLTPIFYPLTALPARFLKLFYLNPLTFVVEYARAVLIYGVMPDWQFWGVLTALSALAMWLGFIWFQKTRKGFADVL